MMSRRAEWIGMLTGVCMFLGCLLALTVKTQQAVRAGVPGLANISSSQDLAHEWQTMQQKIQSLQRQLDKQHAQGYHSNAQQQLAMEAGSLAATGPGILITLQDAPRAVSVKDDPSLPPDINTGLIHDVDLLRVTNELFAAGAEAIAIDGQRIGPRTAIRCVGPVVNVNQVGCAEPFHVQAIGDPTTLEGALHLPGGIIQELQGVGCQIDIQKKTSLTLPAYEGSSVFRYLKPLKTPGVTAQIATAKDDGDLSADGSGDSSAKE